MLLTPRVLDRRVYDEMVASLSGLIERAETESAQLLGKAEAVTKLKDALRAASKALQATVSNASETRAGLEHARRSAADLVGRAEATAERIEQAVAKLGDGLDPEKLEARIEQAVDERVEAQVEAQVRARVEAAVQTLLETTVHEALDALTARSAESVARVEESRSKLKHELTRAGSLIDGLQERFEKQADAAVESLELPEIQTETQTEIQMPATQMPEIEIPTIDEEAMAQAQSLVERVEATGFYLAQLRDQAEEAKKSLGQSLVDQAAAVDQLLARQEELGREMTRLQQLQANAQAGIQPGIQADTHANSPDVNPDASKPAPKRYRPEL